MRIRAAICVVVASAALAAPAAAVQPIEGSWFYEGGEVLVEPTGPGTFKGTVVRATRLATCTHPAGQRMWEISGSGSSYTGTHDWFFSDCRENPDGQATWNVRAPSGGRQQLDFCTARPGTGAPGPSNPATRCHTLERSKPAENRTQSCAGGTQTSQTNRQVCIDGPADLRTIGCLRRGGFIHRFRVKLKKRTRGGQLVNRLSRVRIVRFTLDGRPNGRDRRRPFLAVVNGATLTPGAHVLRARIDLRVPNSRRRFRRNITYRFNGCA
jgi:hypothetical protein